MLAGKRVSCHHSATGSSKNAVVTEASYHMLKVLSFCDREKALPPSNSRADFSAGKKKK